MFPSFLPFLCIEMEESPRPDCSGTALPWVSHYLQVHYLCCFFMSLLVEMSGEMLLCSPKGLELGWPLRYCLGYWWQTLGCLPCIPFSPELVPVFQSWVWRLVWTIHSFLLEEQKTLPWTGWSVFRYLSSWCWHLELFLLPFNILLQPPCAWGSWEIPHPLCLQKLISEVVTFIMHKQR